MKSRLITSSGGSEDAEIKGVSFAYVLICIFRRARRDERVVLCCSVRQARHSTSRLFPLPKCMG